MPETDLNDTRADRFLFSWSLPEIFVSTRVQRMERNMPSYTVMAVIRTVVWILLAATVWLVNDPPHRQQLPAGTGP